jgi:hypothetical protein
MRTNGRKSGASWCSRLYGLDIGPALLDPIRQGAKRGLK